MYDWWLPGIRSTSHVAIGYETTSGRPGSGAESLEEYRYRYGYTLIHIHI